MSLGTRGSAMAGQPGFFDGEERLKALSAAGDPLERLSLVVDFEVFRDELKAALSRSDRSKGSPAAAGSSSRLTTLASPAPPCGRRRSPTSSPGSRSPCETSAPRRCELSCWRARRMIERRIKEARFPTVKSLDSFDFTAIPSLNK